MFSLDSLFIRLLAALVALPVHEFAHAWMADRLGDPTARYEGRLTLNPKAHIDPVGFFFLLFTGFGWAKPVPVNPYRLRGRYGMAWVALAGPVSHLLFVGVLMLIPPDLYLGLGTLGFRLRRWLLLFAFLNLALAFFNLFPLPPLDGSRLVESFLPRIWDRYFVPLIPYTPLLFLLVLFVLPWMGIPVLDWWIVLPTRWILSLACRVQWWVYGASLCGF